MNNILDLKPEIIIGDNYEGKLTIEAWIGFQSRQGFYGSEDKKESSDGTVKVFVHGKEVDYVKTTTQEQINSTNYLIENSEKIRDVVLNALLQELPNLRENYDSIIPEIDKIEDFKKYLGLSNVHIMSSDKDNFAYVGCELGCDWDNEHGIGVMLHKDIIVAIGQAETSFDSWITFEDNATTEIETKKWNKENPKIQMDKQNIKEKKWWKFWN